VPELLAKGLPERALFLPLSSVGFRTCLPLVRPCRADDSPLVVVPARAHDVEWTPGVASGPPLTGLQRPAPALGAVGVPPAGARARNFSVSVVDLSLNDDGLRALPATLDDRGRFVSTGTGADHASGASDVAVPAGLAAADVQPGAAPRGFAVFDPPYRVVTSALSEASPALVVTGGEHPQVVYAVRADPSWRLGVEIIPLFADGRLPYLVRPAEGPAGILVPLPPGAVPLPRAADATVRQTPPKRGTGWWLFAGGGGLALTIAMVGWSRRRRSTLWS